MAACEKKLWRLVPVGRGEPGGELRRRRQSRTGFDRMCTACASASRRCCASQGFDPPHYHLLGTSGTVTTLAAIALKLPRYNRTRVDGSWHETATC